MERVLGADRRVRVLLACAGAIVIANAFVVAARLTAAVAADAPVVIVDEATANTVLILGADGKTVSVDPSSPEGKAAIAAAEERGDTIVTADPSDPVAVAATGGDTPTAAERSAELDAADGALDGIVEVADAVTGGVVRRTVGQIEDAIEGTKVTTPTTSTAPTTAAAADGDEPLVEITTPGVSITTPPVSVTTPPVEVSTPVTTIAVETTIVTVETTTVTVPSSTVTVPSETVIVTTVGLGL